MSALVTLEISRLFVNTLTADDKYSRRNMQIFWRQLQTFYLQNKTHFVNFWLYFWKVHEI